MSKCEYGDRCIRTKTYKTGPRGLSGLRLSLSVFSDRVWNSWCGNCETRSRTRIFKKNVNKLNGHTARTKANLVYEANLGLTPESKTSGGGRPPSEPGRASQHSTHTQATDNSSEHVHLPWNMPVRTSFEHVAGGASKKLSSVKPN